MDNLSKEIESTEKTTSYRQPYKDKHRIKTITDLYILNRQEMLSCTDEFVYYRRLMESISIGASLLPIDDPLVKEANNVLTTKDNYPEKRNMNWLDSRGIYSCSSGQGDTGKVTVRPEELQVGEATLKNQQCNIIIQRLAPLDREIFSTLLIKGIIMKKELHEEIEATIMKDLLWD